jgi:hypothetical protein
MYFPLTKTSHLKASLVILGQNKLGSAEHEYSSLLYFYSFIFKVGPQIPPSLHNLNCRQLNTLMYQRRPITLTFPCSSITSIYTHQTRRKSLKKFLICFSQLTVSCLSPSPTGAYPELIPVFVSLISHYVAGDCHQAQPSAGDCHQAQPSAGDCHQAKPRKFICD